MRSVDSNPAAGFMVIAHRGASSYAPENTIAAFDLAIRMGVGHLELDVHSTTDERVVVIHDDTLDRTTTGSGPVASHSRPNGFPRSPTCSTATGGGRTSTSRSKGVRPAWSSRPSTWCAHAGWPT